MRSMILITDDVAAGNALKRRLQAAGTWLVLRYDAADPRIASARLVLVDFKNPIHAYHRSLQGALAAVRRAERPVLCLTRHAGPHGWALAKQLRADAVADAGDSNDRILRTISDLIDEPGAHGGPQQAAEDAKDFFRLLFSPSAESTSAFADVGTDLVFKAVSDVGIGEWIETVRQFDDVTHQHCLLVTGIAAAFSAGLGFGEIDCHLLTKGALLHDIGKTKIPPAILNKRGPLTPQEISVMREHPQLGHEMLAGRDFEDTLLSIVLSHHELLDGSGYPHGLEGREISDPVRLITICDIFAALIERRPYKAALGADEAYEILEGMAGKLDPDLVRVFRPIAESFGTGGPIASGTGPEAGAA